MRSTSNQRENVTEWCCYAGNQTGLSENFKSPRSPGLTGKARENTTRENVTIVMTTWHRPFNFVNRSHWTIWLLRLWKLFNENTLCKYFVISSKPAFCTSGTSVCCFWPSFSFLNSNGYQVCAQFSKRLYIYNKWRRKYPNVVLPKTLRLILDPTT